MKKFLARISAIIMVVCFCIGFVACGNIMNTREEKLYNLIIDVSYEFKSPKSVRVLSGTLTYVPHDDGSEYISAYVVLSSTNSLGIELSGNYFIGYKDDGDTFCFDLDYFGNDMQNYEESVKKCRERDDFNAEAINQALNKHWENY